MKEATLKTIESNDSVSLYSICFKGSDESESTLNKEFQTIILALSKIVERGALERFFRMEGKINDGLCALSLDSRKLRLYCLRISD